MVALTAARRVVLSTAALTAVAQLGGIGLGGAAQLWLGRLLGPEGYGAYASALATLSILGLAALLGLRTAALSEVPRLDERGEGARLAAFLRGSVRIVTLAGTALALAAWALAGSSPVLVFAALAVPLHALSTLGGATARALGHPARAILSQRPLREGAVLLAALWMATGGSARPETAMLAAIAGITLGIAATFPVTLSALRTLPLPGRFEKAWLAKSLPMMAVNLGTLLLRRADILVVGWCLGAEAAGIYAIAVALTDLAGVPLQTVGLLFAPRVARLDARGDRAALQAYVRRTARASGLAALALALPLALFAPEVLALVAPDYAEGAGALRILLAAQVVRAILGNVNLFAMMTGGERMAACVLGATVVASLAAQAVLIPLAGLEGAALASAGAAVANSLALALLGWRRSGIRPGAL